MCDFRFPCNAASKSSRLAIFVTMVLIATFATIVSSPAQAQTETVLYSFSATNGLAPYPYAGVIRDTKGNLYGTTNLGGATGNGTIYKVDKKGIATTLYSFGGAPDGANPIGALIQDASGNFYGTTYAGGTTNTGTVYELTANGTEKVLHSFTFDSGDGWGPWATLVRDTNGNLFGTTVAGGTYGEGTLFALSPEGTETLLYSFGASATDGAFPNPELVRDGKGNFYGTTQSGGANGVGTVFKLTPSGTESVLYSFVHDGYNGYQPASGLVRDGKGNLYGTTLNGGLLADGSIYELTPKGIETVLYSFDGWGGDHPYAGLVRDSKGTLYGTAAGGGVLGQNGYGSVFELLKNGGDTIVLHVFQGGADGGYPSYAKLIRDSKGNLYGTTTYGGANLAGTIYKVTP
jgi:uncharacterized repeat protein (TIGR03803 family)